MRPFLLIAMGFILAVILNFGLTAYQMMTHPLGPITNEGFPLVKVSDHNGHPKCELRMGEAQLLPYGQYTVTIPDIKRSFVLFKNNRGRPVLHSVDGLLVVETDENSAVLSPKP